MRVTRGWTTTAAAAAPAAASAATAGRVLQRGRQRGRSVSIWQYTKGPLRFPPRKVPRPLPSFYCPYPTKLSMGSTTPIAHHSNWTSSRVLFFLPSDCPSSHKCITVPPFSKSSIRWQSIIIRLLVYGNHSIQETWRKPAWPSPWRNFWNNPPQPFCWWHFGSHRCSADSRALMLRVLYMDRTMLYSVQKPSGVHIANMRSSVRKSQ